MHKRHIHNTDECANIKDVIEKVINIVLYLIITLPRVTTWDHPEKGQHCEVARRELLPHPRVFLVTGERKREIRCVLDSGKVKIVTNPRIPRE